MSKSRGAPRAAQVAHGFTLLELLVGLAVFALLAATAYAGLRTSMSSWERTQARIDGLETRRTVSEFIRRQLAQTAPLATVQRGKWHLWFKGARDEISFLADLPAFVARGGKGSEGGMHEVALALTADGAGRALSLRRKRFDAESEPGEFDVDEAVNRVLAPGLKTFQLAYFGATRRNERPQWHDTWEQARRMPTLVRVQIEDHVYGQWPPILVRLNASALRFVRGGRAGRSTTGAGESEQSDDEALPRQGSPAGAAVGVNQAKERS